MKDAIQNGAEEKAFIYVLFSSFCVLLSHRYVYLVPPTRVYFLTRSSFVWQKDKKEREKEKKT
jgi:hypothetical protein